MNEFNSEIFYDTAAVKYLKYAAGTIDLNSIKKLQLIPNELQR